MWIRREASALYEFKLTVEPNLKEHKRSLWQKPRVLIKCLAGSECWVNACLLSWLKWWHRTRTRRTWGVVTTRREHLGFILLLHHATQGPWGKWLCKTLWEAEPVNTGEDEAGRSAGPQWGVKGSIKGNQQKHRFQKKKHLGFSKIFPEAGGRYYFTYFSPEQDRKSVV